MRFGTLALFALPLLLAGTASADLQKTCVKPKEHAGRPSEAARHHTHKHHKAHKKHEEPAHHAHHHHKAHKHHKEHKAASAEPAKEEHKAASTGGAKKHHHKTSAKKADKKPTTPTYKKQDDDKSPATESGSTKSGSTKSGSTESGSTKNNTSTSTSRADSTISSAAVDAHNTERSKYGEKDLTWDDDLAKTAASWASNCKFEHSEGKYGAVGENLAVGSGSEWADAVAATKEGIKLWADEASKYTGDWSEAAGHWTQMVWKDTTKVGCAVQKCAAGTIFDAESSYLVCQYSPQGNVLGEFAQQVPSAK